MSLIKGWERRLAKWLQAKRYDYTPDPCPVESIRTAVIFIPRLIGDTLAAFPVIRALQAHGVEHIIIVASRQNAMIFDPMIEQTKEMPNNGTHANISLYTTSSLKERDLNAIRDVAQAITHTHGRIDLCVDASIKNGRPTALFVSTLRARNNLQISNASLRCYAPVCAHASRLYEEDVSLPLCWSTLMKDAGIADVPARFEIPLPSTIDDEVVHWLGSHQLDSDAAYGVINLDGSQPSRQIGLDTAKMIIQLLWQHYRLPMIVVCSPAGEEKAAMLAECSPHVSLPELPRSIHHSAALIKHSAFVITPDTAILHIASAFDRPTIGIYREYKGHWIPTGEPNAIIITEGPVDSLSQRQLEAAISRIPLTSLH